LRKNKIKFSKIEHIFISHLHGDHVYGLIGLVSTFMLLSRTTDLHIYGPKGIKEIITLQLRLSNSWTSYGLYFHELESDQSEVVFEDDKVLVRTIPLKHRIYTNGFVFQEKMGEKKLNAEAMKQYQIPVYHFQNIKNGKDITLEDGTFIENSKLAFEPVPPKSYAFCSDTVYTESIVPFIKGVDVLYHESTFLESEAALAQKTMHATARQAAAIALMAKVKQLILGHYSTRYENIDLFRDEAQTIFANVLLANDGVCFEF
jgi:ribonuclease Z